MNNYLSSVSGETIFHSGNRDGDESPSKYLRRE